ncbi:MAG: glutamyl-tRNA reductase [Candidatus Hydrogenedentes bacterium]|nr:glutamyl-tRNA reductase [Candidatus Hydrogenedentota bacterium]
MLAMVGLSHHTSAIDLRERMAIPENRLRAALLRLQKKIPDVACVILSTCNRMEIYVDAPLAIAEIHAALREFLSEYHEVAEEEFAPSLYEHGDEAVVKHLYRVASSLDSMVVGEQQILGQVQDAFLAAKAEESTNKTLNALFQNAFKVAKEVKTKSNISAGRVSVSSVAVDLAVSIFTDLKDKTAMVIGTGAMSELTIKSLVSRGIGHIVVVNRSLDKAKELAAQFNGEGVALDALPCHLNRADILISSTAAPQPILKAADFQNALKQRKGAPMFVIDIAVPRDVDTDVNGLDNVYLYDIDDLQQVADQNLEARRAEVAACMEIVDRHVQQYLRWQKSLAAEPTIVSMSRELHAIRERELEKSLSELPDLTEKQRE